MNHATIISAIGLCLLISPAAAEVEVSVYGGFQQALPSDVTIAGDDEIADRDLNITWDGKPFTAPPYYGLRITQWQSGTFGYGLEFTHNKIYPQDGELPTDISRLEFTDGLNTLTANAYYRFDALPQGITPYVGGGLGVAVPHVEVTSGDSRTAEFQITGPAATMMAGASFPIADQWSVFGEYKSTFTSNEGDLVGGGTVRTDVVTSAINLGLSFSF